MEDMNLKVRNQENAEPTGEPDSGGVPAPATAPHEPAVGLKDKNLKASLEKKAEQDRNEIPREHKTLYAHAPVNHISHITSVHMSQFVISRPVTKVT